jgi:hypothetical protein
MLQASKKTEEEQGQEEKKMHAGLWWESQKERINWEDLDVDGRIMLKWILEMGWGVMDWFDLAHDNDQWRAFVNRVMDFGVPYNFWKFLNS